MGISDVKQRNIWVYDWASDNLTQLTFDHGNDLHAVWTPSGRRIVFAFDRGKPGFGDLYRIDADRPGETSWPGSRI